MLLAYGPSPYIIIITRQYNLYTRSFGGWSGRYIGFQQGNVVFIKWLGDRFALLFILAFGSRHVSVNFLVL